MIVDAAAVEMAGARIELRCPVLDRHVMNDGDRVRGNIEYPVNVVSIDHGTPQTTATDLHRGGDVQVTVGGWIDSPAGAYVADPSLSARANFGFVSTYKKGATAPHRQDRVRFPHCKPEFPQH